MTSERKTRTVISEAIFNQIKRFYKTKSKSELMEITALSKSALNKAIKKIEECENEEPLFENLFDKPGRKKKDKIQLHTNIRNVMGGDNSLTQIGCLEALESNISLTQLCREVKAAGLTRKRIKYKANVLLNDSSIRNRQIFCSRIQGMRNRQILFLDESGFNLHTSISYGYSMIGTDAVSYQPASRGKNISLCAIISISGILFSKLIEGAFNQDIFKSFLIEADNLGIFSFDLILIMDNVRFHHSDSITNFLEENHIQAIFLPSYSPDLNPIENVFSAIKSRLHAIRPKATTREQLKSNIRMIIENIGSLVEYYHHFGNKVNKIVNREIQ